MRKTRHFGHSGSIKCRVLSARLRPGPVEVSRFLGPIAMRAPRSVVFSRSDCVPGPCRPSPKSAINTALRFPEGVGATWHHVFSLSDGDPDRAGTPRLRERVPTVRADVLRLREGARFLCREFQKHVIPGSPGARSGVFSRSDRRPACPPPIRATPLEDLDLTPLRCREWARSFLGQALTLGIRGGSDRHLRYCRRIFGAHRRPPRIAESIEDSDPTPARRRV